MINNERPACALSTKDFYYDLPQDRIAQTPLEPRDSSRLMVLNRETGEICAVLEEDALDELRDQGGLDLHELNSSEPLILKELVRNLFLFCYARALR